MVAEIVSGIVGVSYFDWLNKESATDVKIEQKAIIAIKDDSIDPVADAKITGHTITYDFRNIDMEDFLNEVDGDYHIINQVRLVVMKPEVINTSIIYEKCGIDKVIVSLLTGDTQVFIGSRNMTITYRGYVKPCSLASIIDRESIDVDDINCGDEVEVCVGAYRHKFTVSAIKHEKNRVFIGDQLRFFAQSFRFLKPEKK